MRGFNPPQEAAAILIENEGPEEAARMVANWRVECARVNEKFEANYWTQVLNFLFAGVA